MCQRGGDVCVCAPGQVDVKETSYRAEQAAIQAADLGLVPGHRVS